MAEDPLIDQIYEAALLPVRWQAVLGRMSGLAGGEGAVLVARGPQGLRMETSSAEFRRFVEDYFHHFPTGGERLRRLAALQRQGFVSDLDVFTETELRHEPMFRDFLWPRGMGQGGAAMFRLPTGDELILHVEGRRTAGPLPSRMDLAPLDMLRPHVARAAMFAARLDFQAAQTAVDALTRLGLAAAALGSQMDLRLCNPDFETELATGTTWLQRGAGRIALRDPAAQSMLVAGLARLQGAGQVGSIPLVGWGAPPAVLHLLPVRGAVRDIFAATAALLVVTRQRQGLPQAAPLLAALFDLTPAEADVARRLQAGQRLDAIAREGGKSLETVRNQLKRVLEKTGCRRQSELLLLLSHLVPGWAAPGPPPQA